MLKNIFKYLSNVLHTKDNKVVLITIRNRMRAIQRYLVQCITKYNFRVILLIFFIGFSSFLSTKSNLVYSYVAKFESTFKFLIFYEFLELLVILVSCIFFIFMYSNNSMNLKLKIYFEKLPIFNKFFFILFTVCYGIPNKIWVNNKLSSIVVSFSIFLIIVSSNVFPIMILLYVIFWITVLESYLFAILYEDRASFRNFINNNLFNNNISFSKDYFSFFWGNMNSGGAGKGRAGIFGTILGGLYNAGRNQERNHVREQGKIEAQQHINNSTNKPKTPQESLDFQKKVEDHVIDRDTIILKGEKQVKIGVDKFLDWWNNS